jgi:hypothetical protein
MTFYLIGTVYWEDADGKGHHSDINESFSADKEKDIAIRIHTIIKEREQKEKWASNWNSEFELAQVIFKIRKSLNS